MRENTYSIEKHARSAVDLVKGKLNLLDKNLCDGVASAEWSGRLKIKELEKTKNRIMKQTLSKKRRRNSRKYIKYIRRMMKAWIERDHPHDNSLNQYRISHKYNQPKFLNLLWEEDLQTGPLFAYWSRCSYEYDEWDYSNFCIWDIIMHDLYLEATKDKQDWIDEDNWENYSSWCSKNHIDHVTYLESFPKKNRMPKDFKLALFKMNRTEWTEPRKWCW